MNEIKLETPNSILADLFSRTGIITVEWHQRQAIERESLQRDRYDFFTNYVMISNMTLTSSPLLSWIKVHTVVLTRSLLVGLALIGMVAFFFAGMAVRGMMEGTATQEPLFSREATGYTFISPLLDCGSPTTMSSSSLSDAINRVITQEKNAGHITQAAVYFRDLNNGPVIGINQYEKFNPASLMKVPLMMAYLRWAEVDPTVMSKKLVFENMDDTLEQNIVPPTQLEAGKSYSVGMLLDLLITESHNGALMVLGNAIDQRYLEETYKRLSMDTEILQSKPAEYEVTVREFSTYFRVLYNASYLSPEMSEKALAMLARTEFVEGIVSGIPQGTLVAHKFGERKIAETGEMQIHDCGIVYAPDKPYLICIMTRGDDVTELSSAIAALSKGVYETFVQ